MKIVGEEDYPHNVLQNGLEEKANGIEEVVAQGDESC